VAAGDSGHFYVTGESWAAGPYTEYATIKYDASGDEVWMGRYHGPVDGIHSSRDIAADDYRNVYVTGSSEGEMTRSDFVTIKYVKNSAPGAFSLLSPGDGTVSPSFVIFNWEDAIDPDLGDEVKYDLYISHSPSFHPDSTAIVTGLLTSDYTASFDYGAYYWKVKAYDDYAETWSTQTWNFFAFLYGDANGDGSVEPADVVYLINYLFRAGSAPSPMDAGDANCDSEVGPADVVYLINYLFRGGDPPGCN
jgi:hypothetical protein